MKNTAIVSGLLVILLVGTPVNAREIEPAGRVGKDVVENQRDSKITSSPLVTPVVKQKQVKPDDQVDGQEDPQDIEETENEDETEESEPTIGAKSVMGKKASPRSEVAREHMSVVSLRVEQLLANRTAQGGIGEQVRVIARQQQQAQLEIEDELETVDDRSGLVRSLIGPKFKALKNVEAQIESNKQRINLLQALKDQLPTDEDTAQLDGVIQALTEQNETLQDRVIEEESSPSLLGWLFKRFQ